MHNEVHNLDSLRKLVRELKHENQELRNLLSKANLPYENNSVFKELLTDDEAYDPEQGERIIEKFIEDKDVNRFLGMFWGRLDVYAKRAKKWELLSAV